jgi:hypothetical protein
VHHICGLLLHSDEATMCQVQLEGTGKWPMDGEAASQMRAALGCEMAAALETQWAMFTCATKSHVDVYINGFAIRMLLCSDRDDALADRTAKVSLRAQ